MIQDTGRFVDLSDTLYSVLPPLPQPRTAVQVWVFWRAAGVRDSILAPAMFAFVGPEPSDPRVYDYAWFTFTRYRNIRWRLDDPELTIWFDPVYPVEYREAMMRGFRKWEGVLAAGKPRFRETDTQQGAHILVESQFAAGAASPEVDDTATRLEHVNVSMFLFLENPAPPENYFLTAVHEAGHALGLWAHSPFIGDVMSSFGDESLPSERDIATIRHLYAQPPDLTD
jgi:hypothetical protein